MKKMVLIVSVLLFAGSLLAKEHPPKHYLKHKISSGDKRYATFHRALELLSERGAKVLVETGTSRCGANNYGGDGGSSMIFSKWAQDYNAEFFSVDIDQAYLNNARSAVYKNLKNVNPNLHFVCSDSVTFLQNFGKAIDFLYLDSYDFEEHNPFPSQHHHLLEVCAAYPFLTEDSVVLIDDCGLPHGGKGKLAAQFLMGRGWKILENGYQVLLIYPK